MEKLGGSPKQRPISALETWYRYYAGYADDFVREIVEALPHDVGSLLDPWNGSGTTTHYAANQGHSAYGYDINPAAIVVAKSRLLRADVADSLLPLTLELLGSVEDVSLDEDDLLLRWMTPKATRSVRRLCHAINRALVSLPDFDRVGHWTSNLSSLAAVFYVGLFRIVRQLLMPFIGTNPTWIRQRISRDDRLDFDLRTLRPKFVEVMASLTRLVRTRSDALESGQVDLALVDSTDLPLESESINTVITSPPYCTRIDYAIATLPELCVLNLSPASLRALRDRLIGTPTMSTQRASRSYGECADSLLEKVRQHRSRASSSYYAKFFEQYLDGMAASLGEISRVMAPESTAVVVVQDSYYKELHVDVPKMITELALQNGCTLSRRSDYRVSTRAYMNTRARHYRDDRSAVEAVLMLRKP